MDWVAKYELDGKTLRIYQDEYCDNNPMENEHLGTLYCLHKRYALGDRHDWPGYEELSRGLLQLAGYGSPVDVPLEDLIDKLNRRGFFTLVLYLYDHSGISISARSFVGRAQHAEWDSGIVGLYVVTPQEARNWLMVDRLTKTRRQQVAKYMLQTVEEYDMFLRGEVYGFVLSDTQSGEELSSCWGFIGPYTNCGILSYLSNEWQQYMMLKEGWKS